MFDHIVDVLLVFHSFGYSPAKSLALRWMWTLPDYDAPGMTLHRPLLYMNACYRFSHWYISITAAKTSLFFFLYNFHYLKTFPSSQSHYKHSHKALLSLFNK